VTIIKNISTFIIKISLMFVLAWMIYEMLLNNESFVFFKDYINKGIMNHFIIDSIGEKSFSFFKMIAVISIFFISFTNTILLCTDLSSGAREIIKYHSKDQIYFSLNMLKVPIKSFLFEYITLILIIIINYWVLNGSIGSFKTFLIFFIYLFFIYIQLFTFIILASKNSMLTFVYYLILTIILPYIYTHIIGSIILFLVNIGLIFTSFGNYIRGENG